MSGRMGSISRRDEGRAVRTKRLLTFVFMQAILAIALAGVAYLRRSDARVLALCLATLLVPVGWGVVYVAAHLKVERARREGTWSAEWEKGQGKTAAGALGAIMLVWILLAVLLVLYV